MDLQWVDYTVTECAVLDWLGSQYANTTHTQLDRSDWLELLEQKHDELSGTLEVWALFVGQWQQLILSVFPAQDLSRDDTPTQRSLGGFLP